MIMDVYMEMHCRGYREGVERKVKICLDVLKARKDDGTPYIYAVDFDGTLSLSAGWPDIGEPNKKLINKLIDLQNDGAKIILWTQRKGKQLADAVKWCEMQGLNFDAINDDVLQIKLAWNYETTRKIYADYYIDDHSMNMGAFL